MENLRGYLESISCIDSNCYQDIINQYGEDELLLILKEIVDDCEEFDYSKQVELWDRYGYCFASLHYYPFYDAILKHFQKSSCANRQKYSCEVLSLDEEVKYGFQLLFKNYIPFLDKEGNMNIRELLSSIVDDDMKKYVISRVLSFYQNYSMSSDYEKELILFCREEEKKLGELTCKEKFVPDSVLARNLQMYFEYKEAIFCFCNYNFGLLSFCANSYEVEKKDTYEESFQNGYFGLRRACDSYDIRYGYRFSTYAVNWIRQSIVRNSMSNLVRIPSLVLEKLAKLLKLREGYYKKFGKYPSDIELSELSGIEKDEIIEIFDDSFLVRCDSLQRPIFFDEDGDMSILEDFFRVDSFEEESLLHYDFVKILEIIEQFLKPEQKEILLMRCGFYSNGPMTYEEIGEHFGFSRQNAFIVYQTALKKLQEHKMVRKLNPFQ